MLSGFVSRLGFVRNTPDKAGLCSGIMHIGMTIFGSIHRDVDIDN